MTEDIPAWAKDFKPRQNAPKPDHSASVEHKPLTDTELDSLATLPPEEIISLIKRICGAAGWLRLATLTEEELKAATRLRLAELALNCKDDKLALQAIGQLLDRLEGRAVTPVAVQQHIVVEDNREERIAEGRKRGNEILQLVQQKMLEHAPMATETEN